MGTSTDNPAGVIPTVVCILTHNRLLMLRDLVQQLDLQLEDRDGPIIVLDNASNPPVSPEDLLPEASPEFLEVIYIDRQPPNLAYNMNVGFEFAQNWAQDEGHPQWNVVMLCDDIDLPEGWLATVSHWLRDGPAVAASTHTIHAQTQPLLKLEPDADIYNRMQGSAFMVRGEVGLRADESMQWWWQDQDLDWQARQKGGMIIAPGPVAINRKPNDFTYSIPGLGEQAGRDREAFGRKWGFIPW